MTIPGSIGGIEVAREVRRLGVTTPLVANSGYTETAGLVRATEFGFDASLRKPFSLDGLVKVLTSLKTGTHQVPTQPSLSPGVEPKADPK